MTLCDAGPLIALINDRDRNHTRCVGLLPMLSTPLLTTWPCIAEAMYFLGKYGGHPAQDALWQYLGDALLQIHTNDDAKRTTMRALMRQYSDTPMDLADASLVAAAGTLRQQRVFTLDDDFRVYRLPDDAAFEVLP